MATTDDGVLFFVSAIAWYAAYGLVGFGSLIDMARSNAWRSNFWSYMRAYLGDRAVWAAWLSGIAALLILTGNVFGTFYYFRDHGTDEWYTTVWILVLINLLLLKAWGALFLWSPAAATADLVVCFGLTVTTLVFLFIDQAKTGVSDTIWVLIVAFIVYGVGLAIAAGINWWYAAHYHGEERYLVGAGARVSSGYEQLPMSAQDQAWVVNPGPMF